MIAYIFGLILGCLLGSIYVFFNPDSVNLVLRNLGFIAFAFLCLSLTITPLATLTKIQTIRPYRKVFGVFAFFFALAHTGKYFYDEATYNHGVLFVKEHFMEKDVFSGVIALLIISLLGITSFNFIHRKMGKYWQQLHSLVFPLFCLVSLHIAFASRFDLKYMALICLVVFLRYFAYEKQKQSSVSGGKYLCVPCGYIYDPALGDPDSGIVPGTKFEDIPDNWKCPVCGVGKSDFIPYVEQVQDTSPNAQVVKLKMLTPTVLEIIIETNNAVKVTPGQFAKIVFSDVTGVFSRSYSVVEANGKYLTFCIKLGAGRGSSVLKTFTGGEKIRIEGIFGNFTLRDTSSKKVFVATGTGLAPMIAMMKSKPLKGAELYFGVPTKAEIFYEAIIKDIPGLSSHIYVSQETVEGYEHGRVDLSKVSFSPDTEFYICGNPAMVESTVSYLQSQKFPNIITEKFS